MIVGFALFKVKKGKEKFALKHMREHINIIKKVKGFIHGYIAKSMMNEREYLVIEEYETEKAQQEAQEKIYMRSRIKPDEYIHFSKMMQEKSRLELFRKKEMIHAKVSKEYKQMLKKLEEKKVVGKKKPKKRKKGLKKPKKKKSTKKKLKKNSKKKKK